MEEDDVNINKKLSIYNHIKKKAANDAQLLMNRIALIQKEEERARKKIEQTKERAVEILTLRNDTQERVKAYKTATTEVKQLQQIMLAKNREQEEESKRARQYRLENMQARKRGGVIDMLMEKKYLTQMMIHDQEKEIQMKQKRRLEIKRMEEEARLKKEREKKEKEERAREVYLKKLAEEEIEAKKAERLVRELEKKEREWIERLRVTQGEQENAFDQLEYALHGREDEAGSQTFASSAKKPMFPNHSSSTPTPGRHSHSHGSGSRSSGGGKGEGFQAGNSGGSRGIAQRSRDRDMEDQGGDYNDRLVADMSADMSEMYLQPPPQFNGEGRLPQLVPQTDSNSARGSIDSTGERRAARGGSGTSSLGSGGASRGSASKSRGKR